MLLAFVFGVRAVAASNGSAARFKSHLDTRTRIHSDKSIHSCMYTYAPEILSRCRESKKSYSRIRTHLKAAVAALFGIPLKQIISAPVVLEKERDGRLFSISDTRGMQNTTTEIKRASFLSSAQNFYWKTLHCS